MNTKQIHAVTKCLVAPSPLVGFWRFTKRGCRGRVTCPVNTAVWRNCLCCGLGEVDWSMVFVFHCVFLADNFIQNSIVPDSNTSVPKILYCFDSLGVCRKLHCLFVLFSKVKQNPQFCRTVLPLLCGLYIVLLMSRHR